MIFALAISLCMAAIKILDIILVKIGAIPSGSIGIFGAITSQVRLVFTSDVMQWLKNTCSVMYFFFPKSMIMILLGACVAILAIRLALSLFNLIWP